MPKLLVRGYQDSSTFAPIKQIDLENIKKSRGLFEKSRGRFFVIQYPKEMYHGVPVISRAYVAISGVRSVTSS